MGLADELWEGAAPIWTKIFAHPFVQGIGAGTLPREKFAFYMAQDYLFLADYADVLALAATKAPDLATKGKLAELLHATLNTEMALHRGFAAKAGVTAEAMERAERAPTTLAYTRHLLDVARAGTLAEICAALLPCQWGYAEIARRLADRGSPAEPLYGEWIRLYTSPDYVGLARWLRALFDGLTAGSPAADRARMAAHHHTSSRYEYLFWEMAWTGEDWPV
jgi:thiaminase/transcriptional activator TenA